MDCTTARQLLPYVRPGLGELDPAERHALQRHLAGCAGCRAEERSERAVDQRLSAAMQAVPIPIELKERLLRKLGGERRRAYRRWVGSGVAAAAALVLIAVIGYSWYWKVELQVAILPTEEPGEIYDAQPQPAITPVKVRAHFHSKGYPIELPRDLIDNWDFNLLADESLAFSTYEGKTVPTVTFRKGTATATVFILRRGHFKPEELSSLRPGVDPVRCVLGNPARDEFVALVHFSEGAKLDDFLHPQQRVV